MLYVDMERGLYEWQGTPPRNGDGSPRVVKRQILLDCDISPKYPQQNKYIWEHPDFVSLVEMERRRRDTGIAEVVKEIEATSGPLIDFQKTIHQNVRDIFERPPDSEDPEALSPKDYVAQGLAWSRYLDEASGRTKSQEEQAIQSVLAHLSQNEQITHSMVSQALELVDEYRKSQDRQLAHAGFIEP